MRRKSQDGVVKKKKGVVYLPIHLLRSSLRTGGGVSVAKKRRSRGFYCA